MVGPIQMRVVLLAGNRTLLPLLCFFARHGETTELTSGGAVVEETKLRGGENGSGVELHWF
jgi:hypothetical protein